MNECLIIGCAIAIKVSFVFVKSGSIYYFTVVGGVMVDEYSSSTLEG